MARSTRRKGQREAEDEDDDDFAWQPKKKKKKKKRSSTGRSERPSTGRSERPSSGKSSSTRKKSKSKSARSKSADGTGSARSSKKRSGGASSSTRKSGSARRKRPSGDDEDFGGSGRRRRAAPPKKKGVEPIVPISIVTATILICIGLYFFLNKPVAEVKNEENEWTAAKKLQEEGMEAYGAFVRSRGKEQPDVSKRKREEAIHKLRSAVEAMNKVLDPKRDAEGYLPPEFEGYEGDLSQIAKYLIDLEKM